MNPTRFFYQTEWSTLTAGDVERNQGLPTAMSLTEGTFEAGRNAPAVHQIQSACGASSRGVVKLPAVEFPVVTIKMKVHGGGPGMLLSASRSFAFLTPFFAGLPVACSSCGPKQPGRTEERHSQSRLYRGHVPWPCWFVAVYAQHLY